MSVKLRRPTYLRPDHDHTIINMDGGDGDKEESLATQSNTKLGEDMSTSLSPPVVSTPKTSPRFVIRRFKKFQPGSRRARKRDLELQKKSWHGSTAEGNKPCVSSDEEIYKHLDSLSKDNEGLHPDRGSVDGVPILLGCCVALIFMLITLYVVHTLTMGAPSQTVLHDDSRFITQSNH